MPARICDYNTGDVIRTATEAEVELYTASFGYVPEEHGETGAVTGESIAPDLAGRDVFFTDIDLARFARTPGGDAHES